MWRLWHKIFGWNYFHAKNSATQEIRRLRFTAEGKPYGVYFGHHIIWLDNPERWEVTPLTYRTQVEQLAALDGSGND